MYRVAFALLSALLLAGCSLNAMPLSSGLAESTQPLPAARSSGGGLLGAGSDVDVPTPAARRTRVAKNDAQVPANSFAKAPAGALSDRDYSHTALDPSRARDLINAYRKEKGLKPLKLNTALAEAAKAHSRDLAKWDRISHYGSDGSNPWDRVKRTGYHARITAENVGTGQISIDEVMRGWKESPAHNKNLLLPDAADMGIALVQDPKTEFKTFWTLVIGSSL
jgi:uncharacterized protein YkwD